MIFENVFHCVNTQYDMSFFAFDKNKNYTIYFLKDEFTYLST